MYSCIMIHSSGDTLIHIITSHIRTHTHYARARAHTYTHAHTIICKLLIHQYQ